MTICVTGGSSGIGRAIAERFAADPGAFVFVNYHSDAAAAEETVAALRSRGAEAVAVRADVGSVEGVRELMAAVRQRVDRLDVLVCCAAHAVPGPLVEIDPAELEAAIAVNGTSLVHLAREALPLLGEGSSVVYVTSRGGRDVVPDYGSLGIGKALADMAVRYLAKELAPRGIRVNAVSPGALDTRAFRAMFPDSWADRLAAAARSNPSGRALRVEEVADLVHLMVRPELSMLKGQLIQFDGGASL